VLSTSVGQTLAAKQLGAALKKDRAQIKVITARTATQPPLPGADAGAFE